MLFRGLSYQQNSCYRHQNSFRQIALYLNMPKINSWGSDFRSLDRLNPFELNCLPKDPHSAGCGGCQGWRVMIINDSTHLGQLLTITIFPSKWWATMFSYIPKRKEPALKVSTLSRLWIVFSVSFLLPPLGTRAHCKSWIVLVILLTYIYFMK